MALVKYLQDTKAELKHVTWPSRRQATTSTITVIAFSLVGALFLGFFDTVFGFILRLFI
jgi:preprotein translocase SecE subunit